MIKSAESQKRKLTVQLLKDKVCYNVESAQRFSKTDENIWMMRSKNWF